MKFKFWIALGGYANLSKKDRTMFYVVPADGNREHKLEREKFVEAETPEEVRDAMMAFVKDWYDHEIHMRDLEKKAQVRAAAAAQQAKVDSQINSLSIGADLDTTAAPKVPDLLDLIDLGKNGS